MSPTNWTGVLISWAIPAASWPTASSFCARRSSVSMRVCSSCACMVSVMSKTRPCSRRAFGTVGHGGARRAQPDLLAAGLDEAELHRRQRRAADRGGDRHAQSPLVVLGHVPAEPLQTAPHRLLGADARDRHHLRADVDGGRRAAVLGQRQRVDDGRELLDELLEARLGALEHVPRPGEVAADRAPDDDGEAGGHEQRHGTEERDQPLVRGPVGVGANEQELAEHEDGDERDPEHRQQPVRARPRLASAGGAGRRSLVRLVERRHRPVIGPSPSMLSASVGVLR